MNAEHRTSNIERPTSNNVCCRFKKMSNTRRLRFASKTTLRNLSAPGGFCSLLFYGSAVFRLRLQLDSLVLKPIKRSVINIGRSMLGVRCSTFNCL